MIHSVNASQPPSSAPPFQFHRALAQRPLAMCPRWDRWRLWMNLPSKPIQPVTTGPQQYQQTLSSWYDIYNSQNSVIRKQATHLKIGWQKIHTNTSFKEDIWMAIKHMKKHSTSLVSRRTQIKRHIPLYTSEKGSIKNKTPQNWQCQVLARMWSNWNFCMLLVGMHVCSATLENSLTSLRNGNKHLPWDSAVSVLGVFLREMKPCVHTHKKTWTCVAALSIIAQNFSEINQMSFRWEMTMDYFQTMDFHPDNGLLLSNKK